MSDAGGSGSGGYQKLPPGWDCKYDQATGNCYYINYLTKAMQLEDPRGRYKQLRNERCSTESIPLQQMAAQPSLTQTQPQPPQSSYNGSPYHVYPSNNLTAVRAFQERQQLQPSLHNMSSSPLLSASSRGHLEMSSPLPFQRARLSGHLSRRSTIQETSFSNQIDTDAVVAKIQNMFPTAGENHVRLLLKRYYNREAVVISALQVEKHPVTMPGPYVTPPAQRHLFHSNSAFYMTPPARRLDLSSVSMASRTASPLPLPGGRFGSLMSMQSGQICGGAAGAASTAGLPSLHQGSPQWRSSPKPHSSPKMKLRYMKNIFPKADEMLLLDILANADNNVQFASEKLLSLGYVKRDMQPHKPNNRPPQLGSDQAQDSGDAAQHTQHIPLRPKEYSEEQKTAMQTLLREKYPQIAERIILMALESVSYAEDRATQILQIVQDEEEQRAEKHASLKLEAIHRSTAINDEEQVDGQATDSILTVVLETTSAPSASKPPHKQHQRHILPSINVTTPTTATTQIILSHSSTLLDNDDDNDNANANDDKEKDKAQHIISPISSASCRSSATPTHSYASPTQSPTTTPTRRYERMTSKSILARSSGGSGNSNYNNNNYSINGYLHGSNCKNNASSYSSYSTSMTSSSLASANSNCSSSHHRALRTSKIDSLKPSQRGVGSDNLHCTESAEFQSLIERMSTLGPNPQLAKGADEHLLLADYVTWNGPNTALSQKQSTIGSNASLLAVERSYKSSGRNAELCKGAKAGLAKGSIYAQSRSESANIKCN